MTGSPNKLSRFWNELKRRRVIHVITVYASSAFVIIELINNLTGPLNLPPSLATISIIVLAVGFPLVVVLSWLYDLTGEGMERTKPLPEDEKGEKTVVPNAWKVATYVSFVVIVGLAVLNILGGGNQLRAGDIQSLVILPFENFTGDDQLENMVSSMHALLIGDVGQISGLRVIGNTSSNMYKGAGKSAPEIARELHVDAVVEGTVMCMGDSVCLQFRLVNTNGEETQIWSADYNEDKRQILNLYNRITKKIANEVKVQLTPEEERLLSRSRTVDRDAYDAYLMGLYFLEDVGKESLNKALEYLNRAVEKDPDWAPLYSGLTMVWASIALMGFESPEIAGPKIFENMNKALELDPDNAESHFISGEMAFLAEWDWEKSEKELLKSLAINPNNAIARIIYAELLGILQRPEEALAQGQLGIDLDPLNTMNQLQYLAVLASIGDHKTALALAEKITAEDPGHWLANSLIENEAFHIGDYDKVMKAAQYLLPERGIDYQEIERIYKEQGFVLAYEDVLRQSEVLAQKGFFPPVEMAIRYMMVDQPDKALDWIEKGYELRDPSLSYITTHCFPFEPLFDNPRFIDIVHKMNLPLPKD
jgi:TolB-like protein